MPSSAGKVTDVDWDLVGGDPTLPDRVGQPRAEAAWSRALELDPGDAPSRLALATSALRWSDPVPQPGLHAAVEDGRAARDRRDVTGMADANQRFHRGVVELAGSPRQDDGLQFDERDLAAELAAEKAAKDAKDILLQEAANILADEVGMLRTDTRMASRARPYMATPRSGN